MKLEEYKEWEKWLLQQVEAMQGAASAAGAAGAGGGASSSSSDSDSDSDGSDDGPSIFIDTSKIGRKRPSLARVLAPMCL